MPILLQQSSAIYIYKYLQLFILLQPGVVGLLSPSAIEQQLRISSEIMIDCDVRAIECTGISVSPRDAWTFGYPVS